jgi:GNAT superfamily N-acetyltransferase
LGQSPRSVLEQSLTQATPVLDALMSPTAIVRPATPDDVPELVAMIRELAQYERALHEVEATEEHLHRTLFPEHPAVFAHVVEVDGAVAGMAIWFLSYSTWLGAHNLYLEDLFVRPEFRGGGTGRLLLQTLAEICLERGLPRLEWWVLDWNPARGFYETLGARALTEWIPYRVDGEALVRLAEPR